jgi:hypothetical protein
MAMTPNDAIASYERVTGERNQALAPGPFLFGNAGITNHRIGEMRLALFQLLFEPDPA